MVQQPINADGSSNFKANGRAVIPVKFTLSQGLGAFVFESIYSDNPGITDNDFSYLSFVDCKYMYNLATSSLMGAGTYNVYATIDGTTFPVAPFDLK